MSVSDTPLERILKWLSAHEDMRDDQWVAAGRYLTNGDVAEKITYGDMRAAFRSASGKTDYALLQDVIQFLVKQNGCYPLPQEKPELLAILQRLDAALDGASDEELGLSTAAVETDK